MNHYAEIAKLQRQLSILKNSLLEAGDTTALEQLASYLADEAETITEEIEELEN